MCARVPASSFSIPLCLRQRQKVLIALASRLTLSSRSPHPLEIEAAGLAALRRSPAQEELIFDCHAEVLRCINDNRSIREADLALHLAIAAATNNPLFTQFLELQGQHAIPQSRWWRKTKMKSRPPIAGSFTRSMRRSCWQFRMRMSAPPGRPCKTICAAANCAIGICCALHGGWSAPYPKRPYASRRGLG